MSPASVVAAVAIQGLAFVLQLLIWPWVQPFSFVLFYPSIFAASWLAGLRGGILGTIAATILLMYFVPPLGTFTIGQDGHLFPLVVFAAMGVVFAIMHERSRRASAQLAEAAARERARAVVVERQGEERARQIIESVPQLVWTADERGTCDYLSSQWVAYTGTPAEVQLGTGWAELVHPEDRARVFEVWTESVRSGTPFRCEYQIRRHDGVYRWFDSRAVPIKEGDGRSVRWFGTSTDIQESRELHEDLVRRERELRIILDAIPDNILVLDADRHIRRMSRPPAWKSAAENWIGESADVWRSQTALFARDGRPIAPEAYPSTRLFRGEVIDGTVIHSRGPDGLTVTHRYSGRLVRGPDGQVELGILVISDITELVAQELDLLRYRQIVEGAREPLALVDRDWRYVVANESYLAILGRPRNEVIGRTVPELVPPALLDILLPHFRTALAGTAARFTFEGMAPSGIRVCNEVTYAPFLREGEVAGVTITARDVTAEKAAERALIAQQEHLEELVAARTADLQDANRELEAFTYAVTHDLRAPLRAMNGFSHALIEDYGLALSKEARGYVDQIIVASVKMGELIDGLLELSRSTRSELARTPVDLSAMSTRILAALAHGDPGRKVATFVEPGMVVDADPGLLDIVMQNLLSNAWKYTSKRADAEIRVSLRREGQQTVVCVRDNGAGFDMAHGARLFKPFQRLHRQDEFPGIGIGLATVHRIVRRHGGDIDARGAVGQGAELSFSLGGTRAIAQLGTHA